MPGFLIFIGAVLLVVAVIAVVVAFTEKSPIPVGIAVVAGVAGGWFFVTSIQTVRGDFREKHDAIYRDATRQGFTVRNDNVYAVGGNWLIGTEVDLVIGDCLYPFNATKIDGTWRLTLPRARDNGVVVFAPGDVPELAAACEESSDAG